MDEQKVDTLQQAAIKADDHSLTHKTAFGRTHPWPPDHSEKLPGEGSVPSNTHGSSYLAPETEWVTQMQTVLNCLLVPRASTVRRGAT